MYFFFKYYYPQFCYRHNVSYILYCRNEHLPHPPTVPLSPSPPAKPAPAPKAPEDVKQGPSEGRWYPTPWGRGSTQQLAGSQPARSFPSVSVPSVPPNRLPLNEGIWKSADGWGGGRGLTARSLFHPAAFLTAGG